MIDLAERPQTSEKRHRCRRAVLSETGTRGRRHGPGSGTSECLFQWIPALAWTRRRNSKSRRWRDGRNAGLGRIGDSLQRRCRRSRRVCRTSGNRPRRAACSTQSRNPPTSARRVLVAWRWTSWARNACRSPRAAASAAMSASPEETCNCVSRCRCAASARPPRSGQRREQRAASATPALPGVAEVIERGVSYRASVGGSAFHRKFGKRKAQRAGRSRVPVRRRFRARRTQQLRRTLHARDGFSSMPPRTR